MNTHVNHRLPPHTLELLPVQPLAASPRVRKRRADDEHGSQKQIHQKHKQVPVSRAKRQRTPGVSGHALPAARLLEVLDRAALLAVLEAVMQRHPETVATVCEAAPVPPVAATLALIAEKARAITALLPYRCEAASDYSYARVKPQLAEFLACVLDFVLDLLPPRELSLPRACLVLDAVANAVHGLPDFANKEFQYTRNMAYEQLASLWLAVLMHHKGPMCPENAGDDAGAAALEHGIGWIKQLEEMRLLQQVERHNDVSRGKFAALVEFVRVELDALGQLGSGMAVSNTGLIFLDLISVDYLGFSISARTSH